MPAQSLMRSSHNKLIKALDGSMPIFEFTMEGIIVNLNDRAQKMLGYSLEELVGQSYRALCTGEDIIAQEAENYWDRIRQGKIVSGSFSLQSKDRSLLCVEATYSIACSKTEIPDRILMFCIDVTAQKKEFNEKIAEFEAIDSAVIMAEYAPDGSFLWENENFLTLFGYTREDLEGRSVDFVLPSASADAVSPEDILSDIRNGHTLTQRMKWLGADGAELWLESVLSPVFSSDGRLEKIIQIASDKTSAVSEESQCSIVTQRMAMVAERTGHAVVVTDNSFRTLYVNDSFTRMFGYTERDLAGKPVTCIFGPAEKKIMGKLRGSLVPGTDTACEELTYGKDGRRRWVSLLFNPVFNGEGKRGCLVGILMDITSAKLDESLQRMTLEGMACNISTEELLNVICREVERVTSGMHVAVLVADRHNSTCILAAPSLPADSRELSGTPIGPNGTPAARALDSGNTVIESDLSDSSYPQKVKDVFGRMNVRACLVKPVLSGKGSVLGVVGFYYNEISTPDDFHLRIADVLTRLCGIILEQDDVRSTMRNLTYYDSVTGLPNRTLLLASAEQAIAESALKTDSSLAVMYLSLDRFSRIKSSHGYTAGNDLLKIAGKRLLKMKGQKDIVGHISADEFVVVMPDCSTAKVGEMGKRIQAALSRPCSISDTPISLSVNIGISLYPHDGGNIEMLLNHAHTAMVQNRKGQLGFFTKEQNTRAAESVTLEGKLRQAILEGRLHLNYQPQIYLKTGKIYGVEALCRWTDDEQGSIPPSRFIPLAEECGLIESLSEWVLGEACRQVGDWRRRGIDVPTISINLSSPNFQDITLPDKIVRALEAHHLKPNDMILELTESVFLDNEPAVMTTIEKAHRLGLLLSLDDFGTGYSSLSYLRNLPISEIKLDQSFVRDLHENEVSQRLSQAIMHIGRSLDLIVLAEGIENTDQLNLLNQQDYDIAQGYLMSRPMPAPELEAWLAKWRPSEMREQYCMP